MYSKKILQEALAQPPDVGAKWACFSVESGAGARLLVWAMPEKLKLLRLLGLEYAVHKKKKAPALTHAEVQGLLVEQMPAGDSGSFSIGAGLLHPGAPRTEAAVRPSVMIGASACRLALSRGHAVDIDLQQWVDRLLNITCPTPLTPEFPAWLREVCDTCCRGQGRQDATVSSEGSRGLVCYRCAPSGGTPKDGGTADVGSLRCEKVEAGFSLNLHFAQIEADYALALVHLERGPEAGAGAATRCLYEFASEGSLLAFLEERLRDFMHVRGPRLLPGEDPLAEVETLLAESGEEAQQGNSILDVVAGAAFLDMAREQRRAAERWRNIRQ